MNKILPSLFFLAALLGNFALTSIAAAEEAKVQVEEAEEDEEKKPEVK